MNSTEVILVVFQAILFILSIVAGCLIVIDSKKGKDIFSKKGIVLFIICAVINPVIAVIIFLLCRKNKTTISENICPQCGKPVTNGKKFCTNCGAKI